MTDDTVKNGGVIMRKGQCAMEYLMTYGWALLVIIIVGAALFALGVLNPATYQQRRCNGFQYFTYMDQRLTTSDYIIHVRNGVHKIAIQGMSVGGVPNTANLTVSDSDIQQGDEFTIKTTDIPTVTAGTNYDSLQVTITYDVQSGIAGNTDTAVCVVTAS